MYTYLEKELVIPSKNIIIIIDYIHFILKIDFLFT